MGTCRPIVIKIKGFVSYSLAELRYPHKLNIGLYSLFFFLVINNITSLCLEAPSSKYPTRAARIGPGHFYQITVFPPTENPGQRAILANI